MVVNQGLRARIRGRCAAGFEVTGNRVQRTARGAVAAGYQTLANIFYNAKRYAEALEAISIAQSLQPEEVTYRSVESATRWIALQKRPPSITCCTSCQ